MLRISRACNSEDILLVHRKQLNFDLQRTRNGAIKVISAKNIPHHRRSPMPLKLAFSIKQTLQTHLMIAKVDDRTPPRANKGFDRIMSTLTRSRKFMAFFHKRKSTSEASLSMKVPFERIESREEDEHDYSHIEVRLQTICVVRKSMVDNSRMLDVGLKLYHNLVQGLKKFYR